MLLDPVRLGELALPAGRAGCPRHGLATGLTHAEVERDGRARLKSGRECARGRFDQSVRSSVRCSKAGFTTAGDGTGRWLGWASGRSVLVTDLRCHAATAELLEDVRRRTDTRGLPIVILTTRSGAKHQALARGLGVSHYVTKPVTEDVFVRLIESLALPGSAEARP
jgi:CheY-like chemotaxis protein